MSQAPHNINSDSPSNGKVLASSDYRVQAGDFNLPANQAISLNSELRHEIMTVNSSSVPVFGSSFTIDIKETNILLHNITLAVQTGPVIGTGLTGAFIPSYFWANKIELFQNGVTMDNTTGSFQFLLNQMNEWDEDRQSLNQGAGVYNSLAHRTGLSSQVTSNTFYINLKTYFDQTRLAMLSPQHAVQVRITLEPLANCFQITAGTLTSCAILNCSAICSVTRLDPITAQDKLMRMSEDPFHQIMHTTNSTLVPIVAGSSSSIITLTTMVGNVAALYFTLRASTVGVGAFTYLPITSFALLNSSGTNIAGGSLLPASYCANVLNTKTCKSSFNTETLYGLVNNSVPFYSYPFSADILTAYQQGQALGSLNMKGQHQLQINYPTVPANTTYTLDIYGLVEHMIEQTPNNLVKIKF